MPRFVKLVIGIFGTLILIIVVTLYLGIRLLKQSLPGTRGTVVLQAVQAPVQVYRDWYGVPHIFAQNEADLFFAMGYVMAQDRLWQMDLNRRAATGTLSEVFGPRTLAFDQLIRTIGIPKIAHEIGKNISAESRLLLTAYADGINAFLRRNSKRLPIEFSLMQYTPLPWEIEHSLAYQRLMAWSLEMGWRVDPVFGEILARVGARKTNEILPDYPDDAPVVVAGNYDLLQQLQTRLTHISRNLLNNMGFIGPGMGSNAWVVAGSRSATGKPLLANDPHLIHRCPSLWYEIHLKAPGIDCYGVALPGVPGIVIGHNQAIAWGMTNVMADGCDFYVEKINPNNQDQYLYQNRWHDITTIAEEIRVKDQPPFSLITRFTNQGPIISDLHPLLKDSPQVISLKWNGQMVSDEILAGYKIIKAKNWQDFKDALQYFSVPAQNYVYADSAGNIGYYCVGAVPIRRNGKGLLPGQGWNNRHEWKSRIPFERLPQLFNPPEGIIVTANNKVVDDRYPYFISSYWEPPYRTERIRELLSAKEKFNATDFMAIQSDVYSKHAQFLMPKILEVLPRFKKDTGLRNYFCKSLQTWNLKLAQDLVAPTIFEIFLTRLYKNIFLDEMGDSLYHQFLELPNIPIRVSDKLIAKGTSDWFDDVTTPNIKETMTDVIYRSLEETFDFLATEQGKKLYQWRWGKIHSVTFEHALGRLKPLNRLFNIGPFDLGGSHTSINNASYLLNGNNFHAIVGPSMRQIVDCSDMKKSFMVIPTGQSGHPLSKHFKDQTPLWLNGEYHYAITDSLTIVNSGFDHLLLKPAEK